MQFKPILFVSVLFTLSLLRAADAPAEPAKREEFSDGTAGYSLLIPTGYRKLSEEETHQFFKGLSEFLGEKAAERARKRPPANFIGSADPKQKDVTPPTMTIVYTDNQLQITPEKIPAMKVQLEEEHKRQGDKIGDISAQIIKVDGIDSLQVENDIIGPNNDRSRSVSVLIPGNGKLYELAFNFLPTQSDAVHASLKEATDSFKLMEHPPVNVANQNKWWRVAYITAASGLAGLLLGLFLQRRKRSVPAQ